MKVTSPAVVPVLICTFYTTCWYYTSSKNAVATQKLVQECKYNGASPTGIQFVHFPEMMVLTALQLLTGLCISWAMHYLLSLQIKVQTGGTVPSPLLSPVAWKTGTGIAVGILHFIGCFCTNMGFALGSASVVQVIKLLEPIETMMMIALANVVILKTGACRGITVTKALSVLAIATGTAMLLIQKSAGAEDATDEMNSSNNNPVNRKSVFFAFCSGFAMASRNVVQKMLLPKAAAGTPPHSRSITETNKRQRQDDKDKDGHMLDASHEPVWIQNTLKGLSNYFSITAVATVPATLCFLLAEIKGSSYPQINENNMMISAWMLKSKSVGSVGKEAIVFHGLYNLSSISVLGLISAQSHSILNVGKRIVNVLIASIAFQEPFGFYGIMGLCIAAMGGMLYSFGGCDGNGNFFTVFHLQPSSMPRKENRKTQRLSAITQRKKKSRFLYFSLAIIGLTVSAQFFPMSMNLQHQIIQSRGEEEAVAPHEPSEIKIKTNQNGNRKYVVWTFPFPPLATTSNGVIALLAQEDDEEETELTLICTYSNACEAFKGHIKINLRELTQGTYYHNYVRDHAYHKFRHMNDFPYHVQAITMLSLLLNNSDHGEFLFQFHIIY